MEYTLKWSYLGEYQETFNSSLYDNLSETITDWFKTNYGDFVVGYLYDTAGNLIMEI